MSHAKNKVEWCVRKAEKELKESGKHRGIVKIKSDLQMAKDYANKAEHYLKATKYLKKGNFSDISASTVFYSMYHCLLAIAAKHGYGLENYVIDLISRGRLSIGKAAEILDLSMYDIHEIARTKGLKLSATREQRQRSKELLQY